MLQRLTGERESLQRQVTELSPLRGTVSTFESRLKVTVEENEQLRRQLQGQGEQLRRGEEYERKMTALSMEIQRLNGVLTHKVEEVRQFE